MARAIYDDVVEYEDGIKCKAILNFLFYDFFFDNFFLFCYLGTPASSSQIAKDVSTFLAWAASPEHDERKLVGAKAMIMTSVLTLLFYWVYRNSWAGVRTMQMVYKVPKNASPTLPLPKNFKSAADRGHSDDDGH